LPPAPSPVLGVDILHDRDAAQRFIKQYEISYPNISTLSVRSEIGSASSDNQRRCSTTPTETWSPPGSALPPDALLRRLAEIRG
jgi:hypothetical protein